MGAGSNKQTILGKKIAGGNSNVRNMYGETDLVDVIGLLSCAEQVVSNDSGLMHIAATGMRENVIYGSSTPDYMPPITNEKYMAMFYRRLKCSPCFKRICPLKHTNCLVSIKHTDVFKSIDSRFIDKTKGD